METTKLTPIEAKTQADYDLIASAFALSRKDMVWPEVDMEIQTLPAGAKVLDIACGTGRLCKTAQELELRYTGVDISEKELERARAMCPSGDFRQASMLSLPFADAAFDGVFHVAAMHHLITAEERQKASAEAWRVLKPGGLLVVTVMGLWNPKYWPLFWRREIPADLAPEIRSHLTWRDVFLPWSWKVGKPVYRYYHAFRRRELLKLFRFADARGESCGYVRKGKNLVLVARKSV